MVDNHSGDSYANIYSNHRLNYNGISGLPTAKFDGVLQQVGGKACPDPSGLFDSYHAKYEQRKAINSAFELDVWGSYSGDDYDITISITMVDNANTDNTSVYVFITESDIQDTWQCMSEINHTNRLMVPDQYGTELDLNNNSQEIELSFTIESSWVAENCELVVTIQNDKTKEAYQTTMRELLDLEIPPVEAEFIADETVLCSGSQVQFTDMSSGFITNWNWQFPGGTPSSSNQQHPIVTYETAGEHDVTLTVSDGSDSDSKTKTNYIHVDAAIPAAPGTPEGESMLCKNPENQFYTTTGSPEAYGYEWMIDPSTAGFIMGTGETVEVNFVNAFTGNATITCMAYNGCGESEYAVPLEMVVNERPAVYSISGGGMYCEGGEGVEIMLDNSDEGVDYEVYVDDKPTEIIQAGNGGPLTFIVADTGLCTIVGTSIETTCPSVMDNEVEVIMIMIPESFNITGGGFYCEGTSGVEIGIESSQLEITYELYLNDEATGIIAEGTGDAISFGEVTGTGVYTAVGYDNLLGCENFMEGSTDVIMLLLPVTPEAPDGPDQVDLVYTQTSQYSMIPGPNSPSCEWDLEPAGAGTLEAIDPTSCEITWDNGFEGTATVKVRNINDCGMSDWSEGFEVMVYNSVGLDELAGDLGLKISPNPTSGQFMVNLKTDRDEIISIKVFNTVNAVVYDNEFQVNGNFKQNIDLQHEANGIYFVVVKSSEKTITKKLVIQ